MLHALAIWHCFFLAGNFLQCFVQCDLQPLEKFTVHVIPYLAFSEVYFECVMKKDPYFYVKMIMNTEVPTFPLFSSFETFDSHWNGKWRKKLLFRFGIIYEYIFGTNDAIYHLHFWLRHVESNQHSKARKILILNHSLFSFGSQMKKSPPPHHFLVE